MQAVQEKFEIWMDLYKEISLFGSYDIWLIIIGIAILATTSLPRLLSKFPFSMPIALFCIGFASIALPLGLEAPHPLEYQTIAEHITELGVIVSLMGAGLKIDRPFSFITWGSTWRLLGITMILTIIFVALAGWQIAAFAPATAMLLGAVLAPTDPVLASEVQIAAPGDQKWGFLDPDEKKLIPEEDTEEDEVRFALTSEAGLNDGLAFPFTYMAVAMAVAGFHPSNWFMDWLWFDVFYKLSIGGIMGLALGYLLGMVLMSIPAKTPLAKAMTGIGALASTLIIYGAAELIGGYGFLATFIGAVTIRSYERHHDYHKSLHIFAEKTERIFIALILVALGGAVANGLFAPLTWPLILTALICIFVIRPVTGITGLIGFDVIPWRERLAISFFGIRGIGSLYYLSYALNQHNFPHAEELWALVGLAVVISIFVFGITATPITDKLDKMRNRG